MTPPDDAAPFTRDQIQARVTELAPWFHNIELGGVWTAPDHFLGDYPNVKFKGFAHALPADMTDRSVLDIGCNAGFYAMELRRRGASRVVGIDADDRYLAQARFAAEARGYGDIEWAKMDVYDVAALGERFDFVVFMGVFYHLRHPLLALDLIREHVAGDLMLFQSMQRGSEEVYPAESDYPFTREDVFDEPGWPKLHFIEHSYSNDWTNYFAPNTAASLAMLRAAGFSIEAHPEPEVYLCRVAAPPYPDGAAYPARGPHGGPA